jgi:hypothetical protein
MGECFLVAGYRHTDRDLPHQRADMKTADADITYKNEVAVTVLLALVRGKFGFST